MVVVVGSMGCKRWDRAHEKDSMETRNLRGNSDS
jgi:hypothetical protein